MTLPAPGKARLAESAHPRVMLVDDSGVSRALMARWLGEAGVQIACMARNGEEALAEVVAARPDVILLDIEMPRMSGIEVLPQLLALAPRAKVVMVSTLSRRNARISLDALRAGAVDTLAKPESGWAGQGAPAFRDELIRKVLALGTRVDVTVPRVAIDGPVRPERARTPLKRPAIVGIGASTGGPRALFALLQGLRKPPPVPILITQHMPPMFTAILAEHLTRLTDIPAAEAVDGEQLAPGRIYVAPGNSHMSARRYQDGSAIISLSNGVPENFCRPSVNPLFRSLADGWGKAALGIVLTGMGSDGLAGARRMKEAGAAILVQDAQTSVVWGMPGAIAKAGLANEVLPLDHLTVELASLLEFP